MGLLEYLCYDKRVSILIQIYNSVDYTFALQLSRDLDVTSGHVLDLLKECISLKLLTIEKKGRTKLIHLTPYGEKVVLKLLELRELNGVN